MYIDYNFINPPLNASHPSFILFHVFFVFFRRDYLPHPLPKCSLHLRCKNCVINVNITWDMKFTCSLWFNQLWLSVMTFIWCKGSILDKNWELSFSVNTRISISNIIILDQKKTVLCSLALQAMVKWQDIKIYVNLNFKKSKYFFEQ